MDLTMTWVQVKLLLTVTKPVRECASAYIEHLVFLLIQSCQYLDPELLKPSLDQTIRVKTFRKNLNIKFALVTLYKNLAQRTVT